jgi:hypothetical protein
VPDLTFFADKAVDRVLGVVMELAGEVYVLRLRLRTIELLLDQKGFVTRADLDGFVAGGDDTATRLAARDAFIERILAPMTYQADSPNPPFELDESGNRGG